MQPLDVVNLISGASNAIGSVGGFVTGLINHNENKKNNEFNRNLATQAFEAQEEQRTINNERYIDERDYNRSLQQEIFAREDTAMQRALEDYTSAGFSPLASVGQSAGAGTVVTSPSQVTNTPSVSSANLQQSDALQRSFEHFSSAGSQFGAQLMTQAEQLSERNLKLTLQGNEIAAMFKRQGNDYAHDKIMEQLAQGNRIELSEIQHMYQLESITHTHKYQAALEQIKQSGVLEQIQQQYQNALSLQDDAQSWQSAERAESSQFQKSEREASQQFQSTERQASQAYEADYRDKTLTASVKDMYDIGMEFLIPVIASFDEDLADYLANNEMGKDLLVSQIQLMVSGTKYALDTADGVTSIIDNIIPG